MAETTKTRLETLVAALDTASGFVRTPRVRDHADVAIMLRLFLEIGIETHPDERSAMEYFVLAATTGQPGFDAEGEYDSLLDKIAKATPSELIADHCMSEYTSSHRLAISNAIRSASNILRAYPTLENDATALGLLVHPALVRACANTDKPYVELTRLAEVLRHGMAIDRPGTRRRVELLDTARASLAERLSGKRGTT